MMIQICIHVPQNKRYWVNIVFVKKISFIFKTFLAFRKYFKHFYLLCQFIIHNICFGNIIEVQKFDDKKIVHLRSGWFDDAKIDHIDIC